MAQVYPGESQGCEPGRREGDQAIARRLREPSAITQEAEDSEDDPGAVDRRVLDADPVALKSWSAAECIDDPDLWDGTPGHGPLPPPHAPPRSAINVPNSIADH